MVRDALFQRGLADVELAAGDEVLEQLRVVDDLVVAAQLRVLVLQRVEAVRALGDDLLHAHAVEHLDVRHGEHLEQVLVAAAAGASRPCTSRWGRGWPPSMPARFSSLAMAWVTFLFLSSNEPAQPTQYRYSALNGSPGSTICTSRPVRPVAALALVHAPRVALVLHGAVGVAQLAGEVALHQRQVAAHVEDLVEDLDVHRADLVARAAAGAAPDFLGGDALEQRVGGDGDLLVDRQRRRDLTVRTPTRP